MKYRRRTTLGLVATLIVIMCFASTTLVTLGNIASLNANPSNTSMNVIKIVPENLQPHDAQVLNVLQSKGIDKKYVKLEKDYGKISDGKSPYMQTWVDQKSGTRIAEISQLPMVDADGRAIIAGWDYKDGVYTSKNNLFVAEVNGTEVKVTVKNDQPNNIKSGDVLTFKPQIYINGIIVNPISTKPTLLPIDPINSNYQNNNLQWDYGNGITRNYRLIEGKILGYWTFANNPNSDVSIVYNQNGAYSLQLGQYAVNADEEQVSKLVFDSAIYPFVVGDSLTFYPDINPEVRTVDGQVAYTSANLNWASIRIHAGDSADDSSMYFHTDTIQGGSYSGNFFLSL